MAFEGISINTGVHICFPYFADLQQCFERNTYANYECKEKIQDYMECHNRKKYVDSLWMLDEERS